MRTKKELLAGIEKEVLNSKIIENNTLLINYTDGSKAYRLHNTDVVTVNKGKFILNSGGWRTKTTKERINTFAPVNMWQEKGVWYLSNGVPFYDGITVNESGEVISKVKNIDLKKIAKIKKEIKTYCDLITKDNLPIPDNGDCWFCLMRTDEGKSLGDSSNNADHLLSHLKEGYMHGSILVNSMHEAGYQDRQIGLHYSMKLTDTFKRSLRKYLQKRLITNIAVK